MQQAFALKTNDPDFSSFEEEIIKALENEYEDKDGKYNSTSIKTDTRAGNTKPDFKRQHGIIEATNTEREGQDSA